MEATNSKENTFNRAQKTIKELRMKELSQNTGDSLAQYAYELEKERDKQETIIKGLTKKIEKLTEKLQDLENSLKPTHKYEGYPKDKDFIGKLIFVLSKNTPGMSFEDITSAFTLLEPGLKDQWLNPNKSISKIISRACRFGVVLRAKLYGNNGQFVYSLAKT